MSFLSLYSALLRNPDSRIVDASSGTDLSYRQFHQKASEIADSLRELELPGRSIVILYHLEYAVDIALTWVACTLCDFIPYIIENDNIAGADDINYSAVISSSSESPVPSTSSHVMEGRYHVHIPPKKKYFIGDDESLLIVTSSKSTSAIAKKILLGVPGTEANIRANIQALSIRKEDVTLVLLPLEYSYGLIAQFLSHVFAGSTIVFAPKIIGVLHLELVIRHYSVTSIFLTPLLARLLMVYNKPISINSLQYVTLGGDKAVPEDITRLKRLMNCRIVGTYGLAEAGPRVATKVIGENETSYDLGDSLAGVTLSIEKDDAYARLTGINSIGFLKITSPCIYKGYVRKSTLLPPASRDTLASQDIAYSDNGKIRVLGRDKHYLLSGDRLVWFNEIRQTLFLDHHVLKVVFRKNEDGLFLRIFVRGGRKNGQSIEESLSTHFLLVKGKDYQYELLEFQNQAYK